MCCREGAPGRWNTKMRFESGDFWGSSGGSGGRREAVCGLSVLAVFDLYHLGGYIFATQVWREWFLWREVRSRVALLTGCVFFPVSSSLALPVPDVDESREGGDTEVKYGVGGQGV